MVGLVGYGLGGAAFHAPLIMSVRELRLSAIVTSRREQVERDLPGMRVLASTDELLRDPAIQLVVISTPTATHFEIARAALEAGKHVVVDKPFTTRAEEADELIHLAERKGLLLSVYQNRRWDGDFMTVRRAVEQGWMGAVYHYEAHFDRFRPKIKPGWREQDGPGSGILYDLGAHLIDQALVLFGKPAAITAEAFAQRPEAQAVDYFHLVLNYGRMRAILHGALIVAAPGAHFAVHGDAGSFVKFGMDPQEEASLAGQRPGHPEWGMDTPENYGELVFGNRARRRIETLPGGYERYYQAIAAALNKGTPPPVNPADSRDGLMIIEAALRSAAEQRTIVLA